MSKDIKKALEHCIEWNCVDCPNREELGSGETVCRGRLLTDVLEYVADLEVKLTESERQIKDAREARDMAVDSWCKNRRKYEAQIAEMQNKSFILYSILYETLEKQGSEDIASQIEQMTGWTYDKEADWLKGNRNYDQLKQQLAEKDQAIESLQEINQSLGHTCNNDAKEIERLREQLTEEKNRNKKLNHEAQKYYEDAYCNGFKNQTAIAELEKVKEIFGRVKWYHGYCTFGEVKYFDDKLVSWTDVEKEIDKQIKSLKGEE